MCCILNSVGTREYHKEYTRRWAEKKVHAMVLAAPQCPCGCGGTLRWQPFGAKYTNRATVNCPKMLRPPCQCGCGGRTTVASKWRFASGTCATAYRLELRKQFLVEVKENAPLCPCGRGLKMIWRRGRYVYCSSTHHGISARSVELTNGQKQLIVGTLLGDGSANFVRNRISARLRIRHSTKRQLPYCEWKHSQLQSICNSNILIRDTPKSFGKQIASFSTLSHPFIHEQAIKLYTPKRTVTREYLDQLDSFGLAVWYMDDGSRAHIHTQGFTRPEQDIIVEYLWERWGVTSSVVPDVARGLEFISLSHPIQLHEIVAQHIIPSLEYKIRNYSKSSADLFGLTVEHLSGCA